VCPDLSVGYSDDCHQCSSMSIGSSSVSGSVSVGSSQVVSECLFVLQVEAVDVDEGLNGRVEYHLISGNNHGHFVVNPRLGTLHVASSLDREQVTIVTITIVTISILSNDSHSYRSVIQCYLQIKIKFN